VPKFNPETDEAPLVPEILGRVQLLWILPSGELRPHEHHVDDFTYTRRREGWALVRDKRDK